MIAASSNAQTTRRQPLPSCRSGLVISLDFELHWGVRDRRSVVSYRENLAGTRAAIDEMLRLFRYYGVRATWATVGFLLCNGARDLRQVMPRLLPRYRDSRLNPYVELPRLGRDEQDDPYHFAPSVVEKILDVPGMELGTHTFSHFLTSESGANGDAFRADLEAAIAVSARYGVALESIVFPRNQCAAYAVRICNDFGLKAYRSNGPLAIYDFASRSSRSLPARGMRAIDTYLPITRTSCATRGAAADLPVAVPASRFLRPTPGARLPTPAGAALETLKLRRILAGMREAAALDRLFHLWWHPHNFGRDIAGNVELLDKVLRHYRSLQLLRGMQSMTMADAASWVTQEAPDA